VNRSPPGPSSSRAALASRMLVHLFGDNAARWRLQFFSFGGRSIPLAGGTPDTAPGRYDEASALIYVDAECPTTLPMHGAHDEMAPVAAVRANVVCGGDGRVATNP
jgi:hypothetical protein